MVPPACHDHGYPVGAGFFLSVRDFQTKKLECLIQKCWNMFQKNGLMVQFAQVSFDVDAVMVLSFRRPFLAHTKHMVLG